MSPSQARILVVSSNPVGTDRLRLDREHRSLDACLAKVSVDTSILRRLHAATIRDIADAVQGRSFEIIQFSGHGDSTGIIVERSDGGEELVDAARLAILLRTAADEPRAILLMSCFSTDSVGQLAAIAPYLITLAGEASDDAAIEFISRFYQRYLESANVESAFFTASGITAATWPERRLFPVLSRRAATRGGVGLVTVACPSHDTVLVDTTDVEEDIKGLGIARDEFLSVLSRKIRVHRWVFVGSSEGTLLQVGPYFGVFSWERPDDAVVLRRLMCLRAAASDQDAAVFCGLLVAYNDLKARRYREPTANTSGSLDRDLKTAIDDHHTIAAEYLSAGTERSEVVRRLVPETFRTVAAMIPATLRSADAAFHRDDRGRTVAYVEMALTALHDLVDALAERVTVRVPRGNSNE